MTFHHSFQIVENIFEELTTIFLNSEGLQKLLFYSDPHAMEMKPLTQEQKMEVLNQIYIVPKKEIFEQARPALILAVDGFSAVDDLVFRDAVLMIDIVCPYTIWKLDNFKLRPYIIGGLIDKLINNKTIGGSPIHFVGANIEHFDSTMGGLNLHYRVETISLHVDE